MIHVAAGVEAVGAVLSPLETVLAICSLVAFPLACLGFLALVWKISWTLRGWVEAQQAHATVQGQMVEAIREFAETQKEANRHLQTGQELLTERLDRFDAEREDVHLAIRAMNRKLNYVEGEDVKVNQRPT